MPLKARDLRHSSRPKDDEELKKEGAPAHPRHFSRQDEDSKSDESPDSDRTAAGPEWGVQGESETPDQEVKMNVYSEDNLSEEKQPNSFQDEDQEATLSDLSAKYREEGEARPRRFGSQSTLDEDSQPARPSYRPGYEETDAQPSRPGAGSQTRFQIPSSGVYSGGRQGRNGKLKFFILLLIGVLVIGVSIYSLKGKMGLSALKGLNPFKTHPTPTPAAQVEETPTPVPTPAFDRSQFTIRVLNGTSKIGLAGTTAGTLKGLGYQVDKTGNASNSAFLQTLVLVKPDDASLSGQLIQDLSPQFQASSGGELKSSDSDDAEVILGNK